MIDFFGGYRISTSLPTLPANTQVVVNTINPHSYATAKQDPEFKSALLASDVLIPDGIGIIWALRFLNGVKAKRRTGADVHLELLETARQKPLKVFYLGASEFTLQRIKNKAEAEYSLIQINTFSPPYKSEFSEAENEEMIRIINEFEPDILFVGMTAPKQEKWVFKHRRKLKVTIVCSIGAVFDFYAGTVSRPAKIWRLIGLEWFIRLLNEPLRLYKRTFISAPIFVFDVIRVKFGNKL